MTTASSVATFPSLTQLVEPASHGRVMPSAQPISFARAMATWMTVSILVVFIGSTMSLGLYLDNYGAGAALGLYLAAWIGVGMGFVAGGAHWARDHEHD